jgi:site-specific DNA-methyltransferase (adenine-specific)
VDNFKTSNGILLLGNCLELMPKLPDKCVGMILCDLPYGTTACKWDTVIPFEPLWKEYKRLCRGAVVLTASQPFTSALVMSNVGMFKYAWVWAKGSAANPQLAKIQPLKTHEDVCVFGQGRVLYNPQGLEKFTGKSQQGAKSELGHIKRNIGGYVQEFTNYPKSIQQFSRDKGVHPTQKPVALFEYLIKTYTNEGMLVLDNCIGSGTTAVACENLGRRWVGMEQEEKYFEIAKRRIEDAKP